MGLIALPAKGGPEGSASMWINPDHITSLTPHFTASQNDSGNVVHLSVQLKLQGLPMMEVWLATSTDREAVTGRWTSFIAAVNGGMNQGRSRMPDPAGAGA